LYVNLAPGPYYITYDLNAPSALAGFSTAPSGVTFGVIGYFIGEGENQTNINGVYDQVHIGSRVNMSLLSLGNSFNQNVGIREVMVGIVNNELSVAFSSCTFDEALPAPSLVILEDQANYKIQGVFSVSSATGTGNNFTKAIIDPAGSGNPFYVIYKTFITPIVCNIVPAANYTIVFATVN